MPNSAKACIELGEPVPRGEEKPYTAWVAAGPLQPFPVNENAPDISFADVCFARRTCYGGNALTTAEVGSLLHFVARTTTVVHASGREVAKLKPTLSAGAKHPIHLVVFEGMADHPLAHVYDDERHGLIPLPLAQLDDVAPLYGHAMSSCRSERGTLFLFVAEWGKTASRYSQHESLVWRDAGALLQQFSLAASALKLNCVPMGYTGDALVRALFGNDERFCGVGGCLVASP